MELRKFKDKDLEELANELELPPKSAYKNIENVLQKKEPLPKGPCELLYNSLTKNFAGCWKVTRLTNLP